MRRRIALDRTAFAGVLIALLTGIFAAFAHCSEVNEGNVQSCTPQPLVGFWFAGLAVVTACTALFAPRAAPVAGLNRPVHIWRRLVAFILDIHLLALVTVAAENGLSQLPPDFAEALRIGVPAQDVSSPDQAGPARGVLSILVAAGYFWLQPKFGRATPGQYIMGYRIENDPDPEVKPRHFLRTIAAFFAACSWHLWGWFVKYEDTRTGNYWWDRIGNTRAVFVGPY